MDINFSNAWNKLNIINENINKFKNGYIERVKNIDLSNIKMISSDVVDIRGEIEKSACVDYNGILTRVAASVLIFRDGVEGKEVLIRLWRSAFYLPGGSIDLAKDGNNPVKTVEREAYEEINQKITNIKSTNCNYWEYNEKPWVASHVEKEEDQWNGYCTLIFTADYVGEGTNEHPEEEGRYRWHKVSDILSRPDTKKLIFIKEAIRNNGYADDLNEDISLKEGKQLGLVSYCVRKGKDANMKEPLVVLNQILQSNFIKASPADTAIWPYKPYVSLSRDLTSHIGDVWTCGVILDGDKLTDNYQIKPIDHNSIVYTTGTTSGKQLQIRAISKYISVNDPNRIAYVADMFGTSFKTTIPEEIYNVLKEIMLAYNVEPAVSPTGKAKPMYKGRTNQDVHKFTTQHPARYNRRWTKRPIEYQDTEWKCVESWGYNVENSGLILRATALEKYKDTVLEVSGIDITSKKFMVDIVGNKYANEAEERALARLVDRFGVDESGNKISMEGLDITNSVKGIMLPFKHRAAYEFEGDTEFAQIPLCDNNGNPIPKKYEIKNEVINALQSIKSYATANHIPVIFVNEKTSNAAVVSKLK